MAGWTDGKTHTRTDEGHLFYSPPPPTSGENTQCLTFLVCHNEGIWRSNKLNLSFSFYMTCDYLNFCLYTVCMLCVLGKGRQKPKISREKNHLIFSKGHGLLTEVLLQF